LGHAPENSAPLRMSASIASSTEQYRVHSDLNLESLPQSNRDPNRKVWWMNSLAASVLGIGVFLTKEPAEFAFKPVAPEAPMQIEVVQPHVEVLQQVDRQEVPDEPMEEVEVAVIQPIVVAADPSKVLFGVEVKGPTVTSADLRKVAPPPAIVQRPKASDTLSGPTIFRAGQGGFPAFVSYPAEAQRAGAEGKVLVEVVLLEDGSPETVSIAKSSGSVLLDRIVRERVRKDGKWPPGEKQRKIQCEYTFTLK